MFTYRFEDEHHTTVAFGYNFTQCLKMTLQDSPGCACFVFVFCDANLHLLFEAQHHVAVRFVRAFNNFIV